MIEPNYYESFLNNLPPEESVRGVIGFAESLEQHFIDYFTPPINQAKEILINKQEVQKKVADDFIEALKANGISID